MGEERNLQVTDHGQAKITVPISWVRMKDWEDKQTLEWEEHDGNLVLKEK